MFKDRQGGGPKSFSGGWLLRVGVAPETCLYWRPRSSPAPCNHSQERQGLPSRRVCCLSAVAVKRRARCANRTPAASVSGWRGLHPCPEVPIRTSTRLRPAVRESASERRLTWRSRQSAPRARNFRRVGWARCSISMGSQQTPLWPLLAMAIQRNEFAEALVTHPGSAPETASDGAVRWRWPGCGKRSAPGSHARGNTGSSELVAHSRCAFEHALQAAPRPGGANTPAGHLSRLWGFATPSRGAKWFCFGPRVVRVPGLRALGETGGLVSAASHGPRIRRRPRLYRAKKSTLRELIPIPSGQSLQLRAGKFMGAAAIEGLPISTAFVEERGHNENRVQSA